MKPLTLIFFVLFSTVTLFANDRVTDVSNHYDLDRLLKTAALNADTIKHKFEDNNLATAYTDIARSALFPQLATYASYSRFWKETVEQPKWVGGWGVKLTQSFTLNGKEFIYYRISEYNRKKLFYELWRLTETYLFQIVQAYYTVLKAQKAIEITDANVKRLIRHKEAVADRLKVNEVSKTALYRAEAELSDARTENTRAINEHRIARATLARSVCIPNTFTMSAPEDKTIPSMPLYQWVKQGLDNRSEIVALSISAQMARDQVAVAKGDYWPTISLEGHYYDAEESGPEDPDYNVSGTLAINYYFFDGGRRKAEVTQAKIEKKRLRYLIQDQTRDIALNVETAFLELNTQLSMFEALKDQLKYSEENFEAVSNQFKFGLANSVDVMDANTLLTTSERKLADARYNIQLARIKMDYESGVFLKDFAKRTHLKYEDLGAK
ncbi:MAG: TolC family protein [Candidatus Magnetomorum sp.]|nr:TolC family protein [Candidatus Magnetomorum sp.]